MNSMLIILVLIASAVSEKCYWNDPCVYQYFSTKTPYDAIRGDIRDYDKPENCEAVSFWSLHRHGNRNPGDSDIKAMRIVAQLKDQIIKSHESGKGQLCAQDIELFRKWTWNETVEVSQSYLTGIGYEELYDIGKRIRQTYPKLLTGIDKDYYFRNTDEQRTVVSAVAFMHGLTDGTNLKVVADDVREKDDVIRAYKNCDKYNKDVNGGPTANREIEAFVNSAENIAVRNAVQARLGLDYQLTLEDVNTFYEMCRFYRSWAPDLKSPWCAVFTSEDLIVLGYKDDVRHYYRNGYGSWVNVRLGNLPMKDLYDTFQAATNGSSRKITSYFTHDTMLDMVYCALGLYKDETPLLGNNVKHDRLWRTTNSAFSSNVMFVLNRCEEFGSRDYRVQVFINEKVSDICPLSGCTWTEFQKKFQDFTNADLDFCSLDYPEPLGDIHPFMDGRSSAIAIKGTLFLLLLQFALFLR